MMEYLDVKIDHIDPNPWQPRQLFKPDELKGLADSIAQDGVVQPIVIAKGLEDRFYLVAGERRLRAAKLVGLTTVPAVLRPEDTPDKALQTALIENLQREDLNCIEEARAYKTLIQSLSLTQEECAKRVSKERSSVTNALRLLTLPETIQQALIAEKLTMGHAKALLSLNDPVMIEHAADIVIKDSYSVRRTEQLCQDLLHKKAERTQPAGHSADMHYLSELLKSTLQTKVKITGTPKKGRLEISYFSPAEFDRLMEIFKKGAL